MKTKTWYEIGMFAELMFIACASSIHVQLSALGGLILIGILYLDCSLTANKA